MLKIQGKIITVNFWIISLIKCKSNYFIEYFFVINGMTTIPAKTWKNEYNELLTKKKTLYQKYTALKGGVKEARQIRKSVDSILRQEQWEHAPRRTQKWEL